MPAISHYIFRLMPKGINILGSPSPPPSPPPPPPPPPPPLPTFIFTRHQPRLFLKALLV